MAGRTLLQQALPITFGLKAAGWLVAVDDARDRLRGARGSRSQLGGAAGTLASLGDEGRAVLGRARRGARPRGAGAAVAHRARCRSPSSARALGSPRARWRRSRST